MLPRSPTFDETLALRREGYDFIAKRCERFGAPGFRTRLMLKPVVCIRGASAAQEFYRPGRFIRRGAMPFAAVRLLQDYRSVQFLEGKPHRHRKAMFLSLAATPEQGLAIATVFRALMLAALRSRTASATIVLFDLARSVLTDTALQWSGLAVPPQQRARLTHQLSEMIESAGRIGPRNWRAQWLRSQAERWARGIVHDIRHGALTVPPGSPADVICHHRDLDGTRLSVGEAAVELLNLLRPTVAVARYLAFAVAHLDEGSKRRIRSGDGPFTLSFAQEVRRFSPFFPFVGGILTEPFFWQGHAFQRGDWVLLDLDGTDRDSATWPHPSTFVPERFLVHAPTPYDLIPQGGGLASVTHRCPGEILTLALISETLRIFSRDVAYDVPDQDLKVDRRIVPARPASGVILANVRSAEAATAAAFGAAGRATSP